MIVSFSLVFIVFLACASVHVVFGFEGLPRSIFYSIP